MIRELEQYEQVAASNEVLLCVCAHSRVCQGQVEVTLRDSAGFPVLLSQEKEMTSGIFLTVVLTPCVLGWVFPVRKPFV